MDREEAGKSGAPAGGGKLVASLLVVLAMCSIVFYGIVGEDKTLLLAPITVMGYLCLSAGLIAALWRPRALGATPPAFWLLMLFLAYAVAMSSRAAIPREAWLTVVQLGLFFGAYHAWGRTLVFFRWNRYLLAVLLLFALLLGGYGLVNYFKYPDSVLWGVRYFTYPGRLASTYICPNHFAHLLQMLLPFCLVIVLIPQAGLFLRILSGYCFFGFLPALYLTESRAGMLGAIAAVGTTVCLLALRWNRKLFLLVLVVVPLFATILLAGAWHYSEMFKRRMTPVVEFLSAAKTDGFANTDTADFRPLTWLDTIDMIKKRPWFGFGPGNYRYAFPEYGNRFKGESIIAGHPHNEYLEMISEYGLVGTGLFALAWVWALVRFLRFALRTPNLHHAFLAMAFLGTVAGSMVHSFFDFQLHEFPNCMVFALLAGVAAGPMCFAGREKNGQQARSFAAIVPRALLALGYSAATLLVVRTMASEYLSARADRLAEVHRPSQAETSYRAAIRIDDRNWRACKGLVELLNNRRYHSLDLAEKKRIAAEEQGILLNAFALNPKEPKVVYDLGRTTIFLGDKEKGVGLLREAARLRPFNEFYWWNLGVALRKQGRYAEALETFTYARQLKQTESTDFNIKWLKAKLNPAPSVTTPAAAPPAASASTNLLNPPAPDHSIPLEDLLQQIDKASR